MLLANVFDLKVVDDEGKPNRAPLVFPQAGCGLFGSSHASLAFWPRVPVR